MSWLRWLLLVYLALSARLALAPATTSSGMLPDPNLALAILAIVSIQHPLGFVVAALIGFSGDLLWGENLGATMLPLTLVGYWLGGIRRWFALETPFRSIGAAAVLAAATIALRAILLAFLFREPIAWERLAIRSSYDGIVCGVLAFALHFVVERFTQWLRAVFQPSAAGG
jgi:cell shape-determining protein MreD